MFTAQFVASIVVIKGSSVVLVVLKMLAQIHVTFKEGVLDPQGKTVRQALNDLGYDEVLDVNIGKYLEINLDLVSEKEAEIQVEETITPTETNLTVAKNT